MRDNQFCDRDCANTKCRRNFYSNPLDCNYAFYGVFANCPEYIKKIEEGENNEKKY